MVNMTTFEILFGLLGIVIGASIALVIQGYFHNAVVKRIKDEWADLKVKLGEAVIEAKTQKSVAEHYAEVTKNNTKALEEYEDLQNQLVDLSYFDVIEKTDDEHWAKLTQYWVERIMEDNNVIPKNKPESKAKKKTDA